MRSLLFIYILLFFFQSCSTTITNFFTEEDNAKERNEKLMKDDFEVNEKVFKKFQEEEPEKVTSEDKVKAKKTTKKQTARKKIKKKETHKRNVDRPKPIKLKKKEDQNKFKYPEDYPEKLKDYDLESARFWNRFEPVLVHDEEVVLNITYLGVSTGKITIKTKSDTRLGGEDVYHVHARIKTADFYSYLYEVDDYCDSYIKKENFVPLKFSLIQRESSQDIDDLQLFDLGELKTYSFYKRVTEDKKKKEKKIRPIPRYFQDPLSVIYFIRGLPMNESSTYIIPIVNQGKVETLSAHYEKTEIIKTKLGKKKAYRVHINTKHKGKTIKGGNMTFWFSADEKRVFLKFEAKISIGKIHGEIESYRN